MNRLYLMKIAKKWGSKSSYRKKITRNKIIENENGCKDMSKTKKQLLNCININVFPKIMDKISLDRCMEKNTIK